MRQVLSNYSLIKNNTFRLQSRAAFFSEPTNLNEVIELLNYRERKNIPFLVIGEGSNLLFRNNFNGLIIHPLMAGIQKIDESESEILLRVGAGENWDNFVSLCVENFWFGPENLSLIPGSVGSVPVQNIGAYGKEVKDIIEYVEVYDTKTGKVRILSNQDCEFAYRDSLFKHSDKNRFLVLYVVFKLMKSSELILDYGDVRTHFEKQPVQNIKGLRATISNIRKQKLPDYHDFGNAGSFFKNPLIGNDNLETLKSIYPSIPSYQTDTNQSKVPAAWLIDQCGWKGRREGDVGCWPNQPLVLVNYGKASGEDIFQFSEKICASVLEKFGIHLEREVQIID